MLPRGGASKKEDIIEIILDFLSEPEEGMISESAGGKKGKSKSKKGAKKKAAAAKPEKKKAKASTPKASKSSGDPFSLLKDAQKGEQPSKATLRQWVKAYVCCFDMDTVNIKVCSNSRVLICMCDTIGDVIEFIL